jgi:AcrR family transcriptional regulator
MARIIKEEEYAVRRNQILDSAQKLVYTIGYEQMTIQDILNNLSISKGAFYHYFDSKQALLEGLVDRLLDEAVKGLFPILQDPNLPALEKFQRFFAASSRWKTDHKEYLLAFTRMWYTDENALIRQKVQPALIQHMNPLFTEVIHQGIREGVMSTHFPEQAGAVILSLFQALGDAFIGMYFSDEPGKYTLEQYEALFAAYTDAMERTLGLSAGSFQLMDKDTLKEWIDLIQASPTVA